MALLMVSASPFTFVSRKELLRLEIDWGVGKQIGICIFSGGTRGTSGLWIRLVACFLLDLILSRAVTYGKAALLRRWRVPPLRRLTKSSATQATSEVASLRDGVAMRILTERLVLREFERQDTEAILAYHADPQYLQFYPWTSRTREDVALLTTRLIAWGQVEPRSKFQLAITLQESNHVIGNCGIRLDKPGSVEGELGCEVNPAYWNQGYGIEAARAILDFAFENLGLRHVWAQCVADNTRAARMVEKLGMRKEKHVFHNRWMKERWWDTLVYGVTHAEWPAMMAEFDDRAAISALQ